MKSSKFSFQAWFIWSLASCFVFYKYIIEFSPAVLKSEISNYFHINGAEAGFFISVYYFAYALMQLPVGLFLDRFGPKRVLLVSLLMCLLGTLLLSYLPASFFVIACLARFISGLGAAAAIIGCMKLIALWFDTREFAKMTGMMMAIGMIGAGLSVDILTSIHKLYHVAWFDLLRCVGYLGFILWILYAVFIKDNNPRAVSTVQEDADQHVKFRQSLRRVLSCRQSWLLSLYSGLMFGPFAAFLSWGIAYIHLSSSCSIEHATSAVSFVFFGFAVGSPLWGWLSDRVQRRKPFLILSTCSCLFLSLVVLYITIKSFFIFATLFLLFGFFLSAFVISFSMIREINPLPCSATSVGFMNTFNSLGNAFLVWVVGLVLKFLWQGKVNPNGEHVYSIGSYHIAMSLIIAFILIALLLLPAIKETHCKQH
jgi:MFS family permease